MLTAQTVRIPSASAGTLNVTATVFGVEVDNVEDAGDGFLYVDVTGKSDKVEAVLDRVPFVVKIDGLTSVPGEPEGFGLLNDAAYNGRLNYGSLMAMPK